MEFLSVFNSIGTPALILLVLVILFFMIKEIKRDNRELNSKFNEQQAAVSKSIAGYKEEMRRQIEELRNQQEIRNDKQDDLIKELNNRINEVEKDYAKKIDIQEAVGGWRTEISNLGARIDSWLMGGGGRGRT